MLEKRKQKQPLLIVQIAKVALFFAAVTVLAFCAAAYSTLQKDLSGATVSFLALLCAAVSVFASGFVAGKVFKQAEIFSGTAVGAAGFALVFLLAVFEGQTSVSVHSAIRFLLLISSGGLGGMLALRSNEKKRRRPRG